MPSHLQKTTAQSLMTSHKLMRKLWGKLILSKLVSKLRRRMKIRKNRRLDLKESDHVHLLGIDVAPVLPQESVGALVRLPEDEKIHEVGLVKGPEAQGEDDLAVNHLGGVRHILAIGTQDLDLEIDIGVLAQEMTDPVDDLDILTGIDQEVGHLGVVLHDATQDMMIANGAEALIVVVDQQVKREHQQKRNPDPESEGLDLKIPSVNPVTDIQVIIEGQGNEARLDPPPVQID